MSLPKLVIIDDEQLNADGMKMLIERNNLPVTVSAVFYSSQKALSYLNNNNADIILTDIKMPQISGLELIAKLKQNSVSAEIIILTGYGSLAYAQEAMKYGVKYFLEKPIILSKLDASIRSCIQDWQHHRHEKQLNTKQLIENTLANAFIDPLQVIPDFTLVVFKEKHFEQIHNQIEDYFCIQGCQYNRVNHAGCIMYCLFSGFDSHHFRTNFTLENSQEPIVVVLQTQINLESLRAKSVCAQAVVEMEYYASRFKLLDDPLIISNEHQREVLAQLLKPVEQSLVANKFIQALNDFDEVTAQCYQKVIEPTLFKRDLNSMLQHVMQSSGIGAEIIQHFAKDHLVSNHLEETKARFEEIIEILRENERIEKSSDNIVKRLNQIIADSYADSNLSLKWIANNILFLNQDYIGKRYLIQTGEKFSAALTRVRMEHATQLLRQGYKVYEVAAAVGFANNPDYFGHQFKKYYRMTPHQYLK